jgi:hypothetical protein
LAELVLLKRDLGLTIATATDRWLRDGCATEMDKVVGQSKERKQAI